MSTTLSTVRVAGADLALGEVSLLRITPEEAKRLLGRNANNRNLNSDRVKRLAQSLTRGEWKVNGETIKLAPDGQLLDGQHRLAAIAQSGVAIHTHVGVFHSDIIDTVDIGARRSFADYLKIRQFRNAAILAASVNLWCTFKQRGTFDTNVGLGLTHQQLWLALSDREGALITAVTEGIRLRGHIKAPGSVLATCYLLFSDIDEDDATVFFAMLSSGSNLDDDDPIFRLRERIRQNAARNMAKLDSVDIGALIIKAWNAWRKGQKVRQLTWRPGGVSREAFPIPV